MGFYINGLADLDKVSQLKKKFENVQVLKGTPNWYDIPEDKAIICVVDNFAFEAALYAYDEAEFDRVRIPDGRRRTWLIMDKLDAMLGTDYYKHHPNEVAAARLLK